MLEAEGDYQEVDQEGEEGEGVYHMLGEEEGVYHVLGETGEGKGVGQGEEGGEVTYEVPIQSKSKTGGGGQSAGKAEMEYSTLQHN